MQTKEYDVVVVGGGPAGGQMSRSLAKKGVKVLLVEKYESFAQNNFSSAGMTLAPLSEFDLPETVVGSYWKHLTIQCTKDCHTWYGDEPKGVVLNFQKLREFLAEETQKYGGDVLMGHKYISKQMYDNGVIVSLLTDNKSKEIKIKAKLVVDATGPLRKVMFDADEKQPEMLLGSGTEYEIEVSQEIYDLYKDKLLFFLGHKWSIKGYSWIFPMQNRVLKVGAGKTHLKSLDQENTNITTRKITEKIISEYLNAKHYQIIDKHGGIVRYSTGLKDVFYKNKIIAIGDAVSAINPRGGEGIRYAMQSAELASIYVEDYIKMGNENFDDYQKTWLKRKKKKWKLSEFSAARMYSRYTDHQVENRVRFLHRNFTIDDMIDSLFNFKYNKVLLRAFQYTWLKFRYFIRNEKF